MVGSVCFSFDSLKDPYPYIKEIPLTNHQVLGLVITIILLIIIGGGGIAVYLWIIRSTAPPLDPRGRESEEIQERASINNRSEVQLVDDSSQLH